MSDFDFSEFDGLLTEEVFDEIKNGGTFEKLPANKYRMKFDALELTLTKTNYPTVKATLSVTEGKYKNRKTFVYFNFTDKNGNIKGFAIKRALDFLNELTGKDKRYNCGVEKGFEKLASQIQKVFEFTQSATYDMELTYNGDFPTVTPIELFIEED